MDCASLHGSSNLAGGHHSLSETAADDGLPTRASCICIGKGGYLTADTTVVGITHCVDLTAIGGVLVTVSVAARGKQDISTPHVAEL
jgi:hypothetical protein